MVFIEHYSEGDLTPEISVTVFPLFTIKIDLVVVRNGEGEEIVVLVEAGVEENRLMLPEQNSRKSDGPSVT